jgi:prolactin regulatory element-binding protein
MLKAKNTRASKGKKKEEQLESLELAATVVRPKLPSQGSATSTFRAVRFHPNDWSQFFAVLNTTQTGGRRQRKSYVVRYVWYAKLKNWQVVKTKKIADGSITTFDVRCVFILVFIVNGDFPSLYKQLFY